MKTSSGKLKIWYKTINLFDIECNIYVQSGTRVALDMTTLTIMRYLPREVDPLVYNMSHGEDPGNVSYAEIGGLAEQIRELREVSVTMLFTVNCLRRNSLY